jgi:hypothetical protein
LLVELAEALEAPMNVQRNRMYFPSAHPLYRTENLGNSGVILALVVEEIFMPTHLMSTINRNGIDSPVKLTHNGAKILSISSLNYQDSARYNEVAMAIPGDGEAGADTTISTLPRGSAAVKKPNVTWSRIVAFVSLQTAFSRSS